MSRTVTLRLKNSVYERLRLLAERDNRSLSNLIETGMVRYLEQEKHVDEFEIQVQEIRTSQPLRESITRGLEDAKERRGRYV